MGKIEIKRATLQDLKIVAKLLNELCEYEMEIGVDKYVDNWGVSEEGENYCKDLINNYVALAYVDGEIAGYVTGLIFKDDTYSCYEGVTAALENIFIRKEYRNIGVGSELTENFEKWCMQNNVSRMLVMASNGNDKAIDFYKGKGFDISKITLTKILKK